MLHHSLARKISLKILSKMMSCDEWNAGIFNPSGIRLGSIPNTWPQADAVLFDDLTQRSMGIEFKPAYETKRGCLTALGQGLAYLNLFHTSIIIVPETTEDGFKIGEYISSTKTNTNMSNIPIGIVTYPPEAQPDDPDIEISLISGFRGSEITDRVLHNKVDSTFYVNWRDTTPHDVYIFLSTSDSIHRDFQGNRVNKIWDDYWNDFLCPARALTTLEPVESIVEQFKSGYKGNPILFRVALGKTKEVIRKKVRDGSITTEEALAILAEKSSPVVADSNYVDLRKNHFNFMNQLALWDETGVLTRDGAVLLSKGKRYGWNTPAFRDALAHLILVKGDHISLIYEFEQYLLNEGEEAEYENAEDIRSDVMQKLDANHLIKRNPERSTTSLKKSFADEFTLWSHLGIIKKNGTGFYFPSKGLVFDWIRIIQILEYKFDM